jgi:hypothetical protein
MSADDEDLRSLWRLLVKITREEREICEEQRRIIEARKGILEESKHNIAEMKRNCNEHVQLVAAYLVNRKPMSALCQVLSMQQLGEEAGRLHEEICRLDEADSALEQRDVALEERVRILEQQEGGIRSRIGRYVKERPDFGT